jgi:3-hydroxyacyl-CoA dehydrogenase/3a,7a,12a-trihydroxy-5b-cholest-24-enoyl-CoA hydratase
MASLRFDDDVAVITGSARGLGRAYAEHLASRGCAVLINDVGGAEECAKEMRAAGWKAASSSRSVEDGEGIIQDAIDAFGKVTILINNAGILRDKSFAKMSDSEWDAVYRVHLLGSFRVTRAAWLHMREQRYGRIVMISSAAGLYGNFGQANYSAMKLALVGLANTLALEGQRRGVLVNTVAPLAASAMTVTVLPEDILAALRPELVAPVVAFLAHKSHEETGGIFEVGGGWVGKLRWQRTKGVVLTGSDAVSPEGVEKAWRQVAEFGADSTHPTSNQDAFLEIMAASDDQS